jgi:TonB family protein
MVNVTVCKASGLLAGKHCDSTYTKSFVEGKEPGRTCDRCKPPEPKHHSTLADRKNPELIHDVQPRIPNSIPEGLSFSATVEYWSEADGSTSGARMSKSSGDRKLDQEILSAAAKWKYNPAVQNGVARRVKMKRTFQFNT